MRYVPRELLEQWKTQDPIDRYRALVLHEASRTGGIDGEIAAGIAEEGFEYLDAPVTRLASLDTPVPYSPPLEHAFMPGVDTVVDAVRRLVRY